MLPCLVRAYVSHTWKTKIHAGYLVLEGLQEDKKEKKQDDSSYSAYGHGRGDAASFVWKAVGMVPCTKDRCGITYKSQSKTGNLGSPYLWRKIRYKPISHTCRLVNSLLRFCLTISHLKATLGSSANANLNVIPA